MEKRTFFLISRFFFISLVFNSVRTQEAPTTLVGCFKDSSDRTDFPFVSPKTTVGEFVDACVQECLTNFFRYGLVCDSISGGHCFVCSCNALVCPRLLWSRIIADIVLTQDNCLLFSRYAALRNGEQCACGSKFGSFGEAQDYECDRPCRRNSSQICGGAYASSVYDTGQKGKLLQLSIIIMTSFCCLFITLPLFLCFQFLVLLLD